MPEETEEELSGCDVLHDEPLTSDAYVSDEDLPTPEESE